VSGIDDIMLLVAMFLGPEAMNGLALVNRDIYERLSDRMLCSVLVGGCFGRHGSNETMLAALQQKYLAKIEERGIIDALMNEINSKLRGEDGSNFSYISSMTPLNKWIAAAINDERLIGVEKMDVSALVLAPRGDIEADAQFAKIVRQHSNHRVQFYKMADLRIDSAGLPETVESALGCGGAYMKLDTSVDVGSVIVEQSSKGRKETYMVVGGEQLESSEVQAYLRELEVCANLSVVLDLGSIFVSDGGELRSFPWTSRLPLHLMNTEGGTSPALEIASCFIVLT